MSPAPSSWKPPGRPDVAGGTQAPGPETYAHPLLAAHGPAIASELTRRFFAAWPALEARYGEKGRQHTYEDQFWHLSTLDAAWRLKSPALFLEYVNWLRTFLQGRGMDDAIGAANFIWLREVLAGLPASPEQADAREAALGLLDQAIALFPEAARQPPAWD